MKFNALKISRLSFEFLRSKFVNMFEKPSLHKNNLNFGDIAHFRTSKVLEYGILMEKIWDIPKAFSNSKFYRKI